MSQDENFRQGCIELLKSLLSCTTLVALFYVYINTLSSSLSLVTDVGLSINNQVFIVLYSLLLVVIWVFCNYFISKSVDKLFSGAKNQ